MQEIGIESSYVEAIRNGTKTIEGRLGKPRFLEIMEDDIVSIREDKESGLSQPNVLSVKVTQVLYFETFKDMLESIDYKQAIPTAVSVGDAIETYRE
jgi:ASC-1-like (ASCH) protein